MNAPQIEFAYPVDWPAGKPRTEAHRRKEARFRSGDRRILWDTGLGRLRDQIALVTPSGKPWRMLELTLSTNHELRADGRPRRDRGMPSDPGVAFFFELDGHPHVLACDHWDTVADNIAAIAAHIDALRGQERWGVADMRQAFAGHVALPPPITGEPPRRSWSKVFLWPAGKPLTEEALTAEYRRLAKVRQHDQVALRELNIARDEAREEIAT